MNLDYKDYYNNFINTYENFYSKFKEKIFQKDISNILKSYLFYTPDSKGKLIRSFFAYRSCDLFKIPSPLKENISIAIELFQSFTLIHDDLPALDNDDVRRGKASLHKIAGEANAILIGDALAIMPFLLLSDNSNFDFENPESSFLLKGVTDFINKFCYFSIFSLIDGQVEDLILLNKKSSKEELLKMYEKKTAQFFGISLGCGPIIKNKEKEYNDLYQAAVNFGMAFQLLDDLNDLKKEKDNLSFVNIFGINNTRELIKFYIDNSLNIINKYDSDILYPFISNYFNKSMEKI